MRAKGSYKLGRTPRKSFMPRTTPPYGYPQPVLSSGKKPVWGLLLYGLQSLTDWFSKKKKNSAKTEVTKTLMMKETKRTM